MPADGVSTLALQASLRDAGGKPFTSAWVSFGGSASANDTFWPVDRATDCVGVARTSSASTPPREQTLTAQVQATRTTLQASFLCPGTLSRPIAGGDRSRR